MGKTGGNEVQALERVIAALGPLEPEVRRRIIASAMTFYGDSDQRSPFLPSPRVGDSAVPNYSNSAASVTPKQFLLEKQPKTDVERIACLAYYLTHFREQPHFKTAELSSLNTEAAQVKFANAANASANSLKLGYLATAPKGNRQISAAGEQFVRLLPDRAAAREAMQKHARKPRKSRKGA